MSNTQSIPSAESAPALPRVLVLGTGGTIAGVSTGHPAASGYTAGVLGIRQLVDAVPGLELLAQLELEQVCNLDSKDFEPALWVRLAERIARWRVEAPCAGCVITHGSDTLEETAYALDCLLPPGAPVVLTGAMRPASALSVDGPRNLYDAVQVAVDAGAAGRGVLCALHGRVHGAVDVSKRHPACLDAFDSGERGPLGFVGLRGVRFTRDVPRAHAAVFTPPPALWPRVELVASHAGADGAVVRALLAATLDGSLQPGLRGLVVEGTGLGTVHQALQQALDEAQAQGVRVVLASRAGAVPDGPYEGLNPPKVRVRLMLELAGC